MRGRNPTPTTLKRLRGNPGKRPIANAEVVARGDLCEPPAFLTPDQRATWHYAIANAPKGLLRRLDASTLVVWTIASDLHRQAAEAISRDGLLVRGKSADVQAWQNPHVALLNRQAAIMLRAAAELGFTPSSRSRVTLTTEPAENPWAAFDQ